jgi:hypothetical protein
MVVKLILPVLAGVFREEAEEVEGEVGCRRRWMVRILVVQWSFVLVEWKGCRAGNLWKVVCLLRDVVSFCDLRMKRSNSLVPPNIPFEPTQSLVSKKKQQ